jgi:hypothetical protein
MGRPGPRSSCRRPHPLPNVDCPPPGIRCLIRSPSPSGQGARDARLRRPREPPAGPRRRRALVIELAEHSGEGSGRACAGRTFRHERSYSRTTPGLYGCSRLVRISPPRAPASQSSTSWRSVRDDGARSRLSFTRFAASVRQPLAAASVGKLLRIFFPSRFAYTHASKVGSQFAPPAVAGPACAAVPRSDTWCVRRGRSAPGRHFSGVDFATDSARLTRPLARTPSRRVDLST